MRSKAIRAWHKATSKAILSKAQLAATWRGLKRVFIVSCSVNVVSLVLLFCMTEVAAAQNPMDILTASKTLAENLSTDVTRLALQVAIASTLVNLVLVAAAFRIAFLWLQKPCLMTSEASEAVMRNTLRRALDDADEAHKPT